MVRLRTLQRSRQAQLLSKLLITENSGEVASLPIRKERKMKSIKIIATRDTEGFFHQKAGEVIAERNGENVTKIEVDKTHIKISYANGLSDFYFIDDVRMEVE